MSGWKKKTMLMCSVQLLYNLDGPLSPYRLHLSAKNASCVQNQENKVCLLEKAVKTLTVYSSNLSPLKQLCDHMEKQQKYFYDITKHQLWSKTQTTFDQEVIQNLVHRMSKDSR